MLFYDKKIRQALEYAAQVHNNQWRLPLEDKIPYISHVAGVGIILARLNLDTDTICAGILHDTLEDTETTFDDLKNIFNPHIAELVQEVSEDKQLPWLERKIQYRKKLNTISLSGLLISLADHLYNTESMIDLIVNHQQKISNFDKRIEHEEECLKIYQQRLTTSLVDEFSKQVKKLSEL